MGHIYPYLPVNNAQSYFQRKKDKNLIAILQEQRSTNILLVTNLHFQIKCYS